MSLNSFSLFDRAVEFRAGIPGNLQGTVMGLGMSWTDLKIEFTVERSLGRDPNTAKVSLWNPSDVSVGIIQGSGAMCQVLAGYGFLPSLIFTGNVARRGVTVERKGTDRIVTIEAGDGEFAYTQARFDWNFAAGTPVNTILTAIIASMGLGLGPGSPVLPPRLIGTDMTFFGLAREALDQLVTDAGGSWSIQDGNLELLLEDLPTTEVGVFLTAETGLIGSPSRTDDGVNFESLLNPAIKPGRPVNVISEQATGWYKPRKVIHSGSNRDGQFKTSVESTPIAAL